jgi:nucleoside-diphosphate-sugar epimerase
VAGSADNVFGHTTIPHYGPITETSPKRFADNYYGLFKICEEELCRQYHLGFGVPVTVTRFGWVWTEDYADKLPFGVDQDKKTITRRLDRDGRPLVRHDVFIEDAVRGVLLALARDEAVGEDFNIVAESPYGADELASILQRHLAYEVQDLATDWHSWTVSCAKAKQVLGYRPQVEVLEWLDRELAQSL